MCMDIIKAQAKALDWLYEALERSKPMVKDRFTLLLGDLIEDNSVRAEAALKARDREPGNCHRWKDRAYYQGLVEGLNVALVQYQAAKEGGRI